MKIKYFYALAILILFAVITLVYNYSQQKGQNFHNTKSEIAIPSDKESCESLGGRWEKIGLSQEESCNLPTSDAGKICSDSSECQGSCIAELSKEDLDKVSGQNDFVYTKGKCSRWKITAGCNAFVKDGKVENILCVD